MTSDYERLRAIVDADERLAAELMQETESPAFVAAVLRLAAQYDLVIAEGVVWSAIENGRAIWLSTWMP